MKSVYVASKFENVDAVRAVHAKLRAAGHEVAHDWTIENAEGRSGDELREYLRGCAAADYRGALTCDALILLHRPNMRGAFVEVGVALAAGVPVIVVDAPPDDDPACCIFFTLPRVSRAATVDDAVALVDEVTA